MRSESLRATRRHRWRIRVAWLTLLAMLGCGRAPLSPQGYEFSTALHSALLQRNVETVAQAKAYLQGDPDGQRIPPAEREFLTARIAQAEAGEWDQSAALLREELAAQNRVR